jgi:hypothetical protein
MAIDSNDQHITSEMSRISINDQECHDLYESAPFSPHWPSEPTYVSEFQLDPAGEANAKSLVYVSGTMHENTIFDQIHTIQDTTDIVSEGSSVYPGPALENSGNEMDWAFVNVGIIILISDL